MSTSIFDSLLGKSWEESLHKQADKLGAAEGAKGNPTRDTPKYDVGETTIRNGVEQKLITLQKRIGNEIQTVVPNLMKQYGELAQAELAFDGRRPISQFEEFYEGEFSETRSALIKAKTDKLEAQGEYNHFRYVNKIKIDPDHPSDIPHYLSWVFVILVGEAVLNAVFWTSAFSGYAVKGFFIAAALALINILIGLGAGVALTYKNLADPRLKTSAWVGFALLMIAVVLVNAFIISQRGVMLDNSAALVESSGENWIDNNVMFGLGLVFAIFAAYKGYRLFGSVPGYEKASERYLGAIAKCDEITSRLKENVSSDAASQVSTRTGVLKKINDAQVYLATLEAKLKSMKVSYSAAIASLSKILEGVVSAYRKANRSVRVIASESPTWFDDPVEKLSDEDEGLDKVFDSHAENYALAKDLYIRIKDVASSEIAEIQTKKGYYCGDRFKSFVAECESEAETTYKATLDTVGGKGVRS